MKKYFLFFTIFSLSLISCRIVKLGQFYLSENHQQPKSFNQAINFKVGDTYKFLPENEKIAQVIGQISYTPYARKNKKSKSYPLDEYLDKQTKTTAFLVIRNDSILFEQYYENYEDTSLLPSFSVAKSFTSALVGIAIQEQFIKSESDLVIDYLPELATEHPNWRQLTILHLLNMRSGIAFNEDNYINPYSGIANLYMAKNVLNFIKKANFKYQPGTRKYYSSLDTEILGLIVERATGKSLAVYLEEKIWLPCGMESPAKWSMDSEKHQHTKAFCCIQATARDYAKFGKLFLDKGKCGQHQVINETWIKKSTLPDFNNNCYQYQWRSAIKGVKGKLGKNGDSQIDYYSDSLAASQNIENEFFEGVARHRTDSTKWLIKKCGPEFYALGIFGQEIYVNPTQNLIFVRLGKKWDTSNRNIFRLITQKITQ